MENQRKRGRQNQKEGEKRTKQKREEKEIEREIFSVLSFGVFVAQIDFIFL